ncbi:MAG TPA: sigma-54 dependent transcriptional regulator [Planctomycetota bacterium]
MTEARTVLIVDDEPLKILTLEEHLAQAGYKVLTAVDGQDALNLLKTKSIDALVTDVRMPGLDGLSLLEESMKLSPNRPVLVMTGYEEVQDAVRAMKAGALDYMVKPVSGEEITLRLNRTLADSALAGENQRLRHEVQRLKGQSDAVIVGQGMQPVCQVLEKAASTDSTVLIIGETGTGKEMCSRFLHQRSPRAQGPFIVVPCAALPQTLIESELFGHERGAFTGATARRPGYFTNADGGTILLDDVDDLPLEVQGRLLHVLQSRTFQRVGGTRAERVDVRIVAATKKDLGTLVKEKTFRDDLMYRLSVVTVQIPPLRARREDIPVLADFFLKCSVQRLGRKPKTFTPDALQALAEYVWPGNVRELEHVIESTVVMHSGTEVVRSDLPGMLRAPSHDPLFSLHVDGRAEISLETTLADFERALLRWAFDRAEGNQGAAAKLLGIPRSTFQYRWSRVCVPAGTGVEN